MPPLPWQFSSIAEQSRFGTYRNFKRNSHHRSCRETNIPDTQRANSVPLDRHSEFVIQVALLMDVSATRRHSM